jgi:hypothetical protein
MNPPHSCCCLSQGPPDIAAVSNLLALGANVNSRDRDDLATPLHILARQCPAPAFSPAVEDYQQAVNGPTPPQVWHRALAVASLLPCAIGLPLFVTILLQKVEPGVFRHSRSCL